MVATNSALALELFIKCLLMLEHGAYIEEHHLSKLFMLLRRQTRESISNEWLRFVANVSWFRELEKDGKGNLQAALSLGADTFVRFRYPFEPALEKCEWILDSLILIMRSRIVRLHPEWGAIGERRP